jgi:hypothetical protein
MTVRELIALLRGFPEDQLVVVDGVDAPIGYDDVTGVEPVRIAVNARLGKRDAGGVHDDGTQPAVLLILAG